MAEVSELARIIIGIFVCLIIIVIIVVLCTVWYIRRRRKNTRDQSRYKYPNIISNDVPTKKRLIQFQRNPFNQNKWPQKHQYRNSFKINGPLSNNLWVNNVDAPMQLTFNTEEQTVIPDRSRESNTDAKWQWHETNALETSIPWPNDTHTLSADATTTQWNELDSQKYSLQLPNDEKTLDKSTGTSEINDSSTHSQVTGHQKNKRISNSYSLIAEDTKNKQPDRNEVENNSTSVYNHDSMRLVPYQAPYYTRNPTHPYQNGVYSMSFPRSFVPFVGQSDEIQCVDEIDVFPYYFGQVFVDEMYQTYISDSSSSDLSNVTSKKKKSGSNSSTKNLIPHDKNGRKSKNRKKQTSDSLKNVRDAGISSNKNQTKTSVKKDVSYVPDKYRTDNMHVEDKDLDRPQTLVVSRVPIEVKPDTFNYKIDRYGLNRSATRYTSSFVLDDEKPTINEKPNMTGNNRNEELRYTTPIKGRKMPVGYILKTDNYEDYFGQFSANEKSLSRIRKTTRDDHGSQNRNTRINESRNNDSRSFGNPLYTERYYYQHGSGTNGLGYYNRRQKLRDANDTIKLEIPSHYLQNYKRYEIPLTDDHAGNTDTRNYGSHESNIITRDSQTFPYISTESQRNTYTSTNYQNDPVGNNNEVRYKWQTNTRSKATTSPSKLSGVVSHLGSYRPEADTEEHRNERLNPQLIEVRIRNERNARI